MEACDPVLAGVGSKPYGDDKDRHVPRIDVWEYQIQAGLEHSS